MVKNKRQQFRDRRRDWWEIQLTSHDKEEFLTIKGTMHPRKFKFTVQERKRKVCQDMTHRNYIYNKELSEYLCEICGRSDEIKEQTTVYENPEEFLRELYNQCEIDKHGYLFRIWNTTWVDEAHKAKLLMVKLDKNMDRLQKAYEVRQEEKIKNCKVAFLLGLKFDQSSVKRAWSSWFAEDEILGEIFDFV